MPDDKKKPQMRAATGRERVGDMLRNAYESVAEQPLARIADMLGMSDMRGVVKSFSDPESGNKIGMMPALPSGGLGKIGMSRGVLGKELAPNVTKMHPAVPNEFHAVEKAQMPQSRTAPIDMNNPPSGKIEYLDPDIAEYMNPSNLDVTTKEGQRRLRLLTGK